MKNYLSATILYVLLILFQSCTSEEKKSDIEVNSDGKGKFLLWVQLGESPEYRRLIKTLTSLEEGSLKVDGSGVDITDKLPYGLIKKGSYYYTVSRDEKFGKYHIENDQLIIDSEIPFDLFFNNFSHLWKNDSTLILVGPGKDEKNIVYAQINVNSMKATEGKLDLPNIPEGYDQIKPTSAQINEKYIFLGYKYFNSTTYSYCKAMKIAVLDVETLHYQKTIIDDQTGIFGRIGSYGNARAFGHVGYKDLYQPRSFKDEDGDIYFLTSGKKDEEANMILRIKNGEDTIDSTYLAYQHHTNAPYGLWYLGDGKAIMQLANIDLYESGIASYIEYYVLDLISGDMTKLDIPADHAPYSNNVVIDKAEDKAYLVVNQEAEEDVNVWVYSISEQTLSKGLSIPHGYQYLLRLDMMN